MESLSSEHKACFKKAKAYVRNELQIDKFTITNRKIINFCWEYDNKIKKVIKGLDKHAEWVKKLDMKRIEALPKSTLKSCKIMLH